MRSMVISSVWCPSCLIMHPRYEELSKKYNLELINYDYDVDTDVVNKYNIGDVLPVCIILKNEEVNRIIGEKSTKELNNIIESLM